MDPIARIRLAWVNVEHRERFVEGIERRVSTILACIDELNGKLPYMTARQLAGFVGRIISLIPVTWLPVMLLSSELDFRLWRFVSNIIGIRCSGFRVTVI